MTDRLVTNSIANAAITGNIIANSAIVNEKIAAGSITLAKLNPSFAGTFSSGIKITNLFYEGLNTFADTLGGQVINLNGSGFTANSQVIINKTRATTTFLNQYALSFLTPPLPRGIYTVYVDNLNGTVGYIPYGITYIPLLRWLSNAGQVGTTVLSDNFYNIELRAEGDGTLTYTLETGTLPPGMELAANGNIVGTPITTVTGNYNFNISVFDARTPKVYRDFYITLQGGARITSIVYPGAALAVAPAGGNVVTVIGTNFVTGGNIQLSNANVSLSPINFTFANSTTVTFTTPAATNGLYNIRLNNTNGTFAVRSNIYQVSSLVSWATAAGNIGKFFEGQGLSATVSATSDSTLTYSIVAGTLTPAVSFNSNTGVFSSNLLTDFDAGTTFVSVTARDQELQTATRAFNFTVNLLPRVTSIIYSDSSNLIDLHSRPLIGVRGQFFNRVATVIIGTTSVAATVNANVQYLSFNAPQLAAGSYNLRIRNDDGAWSANVPVTYSLGPQWQTSTLDDGYINNLYYTVLRATADSDVTFTLRSSIPQGLFFSGNVVNGFLSSSVIGVQTLQFEAVDAQGQSNVRVLSFTVYGTPSITQLIYPSTQGAVQSDGGDRVTLFGANLSPATNVFIGTTRCTTFWSNINYISFTTPANPAGTYSLYCTHAGLNSNTVGITFYQQPNAAQEFTTAGTYSWTVPVNVSSVSVVAIGGGAGGRPGNRQGGGGGGLAWANRIPVNPGQSYTVVVGSGGASATAGGSSYFIGTNVVWGEGGQIPDGSQSSFSAAGNTYTTELGGRGGNFFAANIYGTSGGGAGGGSGGVLISGPSFWVNASSGGGGAGGYSGTGGGGGGGSMIQSAGSAATGSGGGGGGGGVTQPGWGGGGGGGVGIYGRGADGAGGGQNAGGPGGSGGTTGGNPSGSTPGAGGVYGAGGGGAGSTGAGGVGGSGAVRIIWGPDRSFPLNAAQNPIWTTAGLPTYTQGSAYSFQLQASGLTALTYTIVTGSLPTGLSMSSTGLISGTASVDTPQTNLTIRATDTNSLTADRSLILRSSTFTINLEFYAMGAGGGVGGGNGQMTGLNGGAAAAVTGVYNKAIAANTTMIYVGGGGANGGWGGGNLAGGLNGGGQSGPNGNNFWGSAGSGGGWSGLYRSDNSTIIAIAGGGGGGGTNRDSPGGYLGTHGTPASGFGATVCATLTGQTGITNGSGAGGGFCGGTNAGSYNGSGGGSYTNSSFVTSANVYLSPNSSYSEPTVSWGTGQDTSTPYGRGGWWYTWNAYSGGYNGVVQIRYLGAQQFRGGTVSNVSPYTIHTFTTAGFAGNLTFITS